MSWNKPTKQPESQAQKILKGEAWKVGDPDAKGTKENGKYVNTFLMRFNIWEIGALTQVAKEEGRSVQQQARLMLRDALKSAISK